MNNYGFFLSFFTWVWMYMAIAFVLKMHAAITHYKNPPHIQQDILALETALERKKPWIFCKEILNYVLLGPASQSECTQSSEDLNPVKPRTQI